MNEAAIIQYITGTLDGIEVVNANGNFFFFYGPDRNFPLATLVTKDDYDSVSNLNRPSVFRLNIGISKPTFRSLFGAQSPAADDSAIADTSCDFTALDQLMPHPVYGKMHWVCVLNPSEALFQQTVRPLLVEAYDRAVSKHDKTPERG
jgi:hypothetical protein